MRKKADFFLCPPPLRTHLGELLFKSPQGFFTVRRSMTQPSNGTLFQQRRWKCQPVHKHMLQMHALLLMSMPTISGSAHVPLGVPPMPAPAMLHTQYFPR